MFGGKVLLLAECLCDPLKFITNLDVLGAGFLAGSALDALAGVFSACPCHAPIELALGKIIGIVERNYVHCHERR